MFSWCKSFSNRLFVISIFCWLEAVYQLNGVFFLSRDYSETVCITKYKTFEQIMTAAQYYEIENCPNPTLLANIDVMAMIHNWNHISIEFCYELDQLPIKSLHSKFRRYHVFFCVMLNIIWCGMSTLLFTTSICTKQVGKNGSKFIIIPWVVWTGVMLIYDVIMISLLSTVYLTSCKSVTGWLKINGYEEYSERFIKFDNSEYQSLVHDLSSFNRTMLIFAFRHFITIPVCICSMIYLTRDARRLLQGKHIQT